MIANYCDFSIIYRYLQRCLRFPVGNANVSPYYSIILIKRGISNERDIIYIPSLVIIFLTLGALRLGTEWISSLILLQVLFVNIFVLKQIDLFGLSVTTCDAYSVGITFGLNLLQDRHGRAASQAVIHRSLAVGLGSIFLAMFHLGYNAVPGDPYALSYATIFTPNIRVVVASCFVYYVVQSLDLRFFSWLKVRFGFLSLAVRLAISLVICQALDTVLFTILGLYGLVESLFDIALMSYAVKLLASVVVAPFSNLSRQIIVPNVELKK